MQITYTNLIYEELTYKINGVLFAVHNELGTYANEKQYCDCIEAKLKKLDIPYNREKILPESFPGEQKGRNRVDFLIDEKLVLEIKTKRFLGREDYYQARRYLESLSCKVALLVNFHQKYLRPKRILNSKVSEKVDPQSAASA